MESRRVNGKPRPIVLEYLGKAGTLLKRLRQGIGEKLHVKSHSHGAVAALIEDYKIFLDMQFQHLATSPECYGLWDVTMYKMAYAEEEAIRWAGRLSRHYCIEVRTTRRYWRLARRSEGRGCRVGKSA